VGVKGQNGAGSLLARGGFDESDGVFNILPLCIRVMSLGVS